MNLDENTQQVLIGSLLGDGGVYITGRCKNAMFCEEHSIKQSEYLKWKAGVLSCFNGKITEGRKEVYFHTPVNLTLTELQRLWYPNGKKIAPEEELQKLNALGLAVWYMDDGCYNYRNKSCYLSIHSFRGQELAILKWFKERWGLNPHIATGPMLRFLAKDSDKLLHLISNHIHPSMTYKLGHLHSTNRTRAEIALEKNREYTKEYRRRNLKKVLQISRKSYWKHRNKRVEDMREYRKRVKNQRESLNEDR